MLLLKCKNYFERCKAMARKYGDPFKFIVTDPPPPPTFLFLSNPALTLTSHLGQHEKKAEG